MEKSSIMFRFIFIVATLIPGLVIAQGQSRSPTSYTQQINRDAQQTYHFADTADFADARRGFIATVDSGIIHTDDGRKFNLNAYTFINGEAPLSVNPALWRQAKLNGIHGLFKVTTGVYQIRGFDAAVMTIIQTLHGYIIVDPLTIDYTARAGLALVRKQLGNKPVIAVISTHSHIDHYGGITGVVDLKDLKPGKIEYIVPKGFFEAATSEGQILGNAMKRRSAYQFGGGVPAGVTGKFDLGSARFFLAMGGNSTLAKPTKEITHTGESLTIDGLQLVFQMAPGSEAPAEMMFFIPKYKAFCAAELAIHTVHNLLPARGAKVRDSKEWAGYLDEAIDLFGSRIDVVFASHQWPTFGHEKSIQYLEKQSDLYKYINDQTIHLANMGFNADEIASRIVLPDELKKEWYTGDFYGAIKNDAKAVYQYYLGWYDGNPANYDKLPESESAKKYVEFMGGEAAVMEKAQESYDKGEYRWVAEVLKHVLFANPGNAAAKSLQANTFEQLAYQSTSAINRNLYLQGVSELRNGVKASTADPNAKLAYLRGLSPEVLFDLWAVALDGQKASGQTIYLRFIFPELNKNILVYLKNGVLHQKNNQPGIKADFTLITTYDKLAQMLALPASFVQMMHSAGVKSEGDPMKFSELTNLLVQFNPNWSVVTPEAL